MRWKLSFAVPVLSLLFMATACNAQDNREDPPPVSLTVTLLPAGVQHPPLWVGFVLGQDTVWYEPPDTVRTQYLVGDVPYVDGSYEVIALHQVAGHGKIRGATLYVQPEATCNNTAETKSVLERIACAAVERGVGVICSGDYTNSDKPPELCEGTINCVSCGSTRVCGAGAQCE